MHFKQHEDGTIQASFLPKELPILIQLMKRAEETRLNSLKTESENVLKILNQDLISNQ